MKMKIDESKPSIWCDLSIENYKYKYPLLHESELCPECMKYEVQCVFLKHRKKFKYFYAYQYNYFINTNINVNETDFNIINAIRMYENEF